MNLKHTFKLLLAALLMSPLAIAMAQSSMTDQQVLNYVVTALKSGKDQRTIAIELARRGVTEEQAMRVKKLYEEQQGELGPDGTVNGNQQAASRSRSLNGNTGEQGALNSRFSLEENSSRSRRSDIDPTTGTSRHSKEGSNSRTANTRNSQRGTTSNFGRRIITKEEQEAQTGERLASGLFETEYDEEFYQPLLEDEKQIFGRNIFNSEMLTFEPSMNLATPRNYILGAGDEVIIDVWGENETTIRQEISPDGNISIEGLGLVQLAGKSVSEASNYMKRQLSRIYQSLNDPESGNAMQLTLGQARTIQVNVMGEVMQPGTYSLSSFASAFHALYSAGGVSEIGSLREINVVRKGKKVASIDIYQFIMKGTLSGDIQLQEGDAVIVPAYQQLVEIKGNVKRPMFYEMRDGETLQDLLHYAGGLSDKAYTKNIRVLRTDGVENEICTVKKDNFGTFKTQNGDEIEIESVLERFTNRLEVKGAVYRPGLYQLGEISTVRQLVEAADGLMGDAFMSRAVLQREKSDLTREVLSVDIASIMAGTAPDIDLQKNDVLYIPSIHDLTDMSTVTIHGEVAAPGSYVWARNMTIEDVVIQAGGLTEQASIARVDVARRTKDPKSEEEAKVLSETFRFELKDGLVIDGAPTFTLEPYDEIYVRKSPSYQIQKNVSIIGEVLFPGDYAMTHKEQRLSDVIELTGGLTSYAYAKGARLSRKMNDEEKLRQQSTLKMARLAGDSISQDILDLATTYSVGIDLEKALERKGSSYDIVLRDGDVIEIPELTNTVKISGAVMHPNTVSYIEGKHVSYYIEQAGGYGNRAKKRHTYIVCMNGQVKRARRLSGKSIEPGCEVIVPQKNASNWSTAQTMSMATASASVATMVATIANLIK